MNNEKLLNEVLNEIVNPASSCIKTGFPELDMMLSGLGNGSIITIGSRPAMGKTAFMTCIFRNLLLENKKCMFFSLNLSVNNFVKRLYTIASEIPSIIINSRDLVLNLDDIEKLNKVKESLETSRFKLSETIDLGKIIEEIDEYQPEIVFIDYLQMVDISKKKQRSEMISDIMQKLKVYAKEKGIIFFITSQLSRALECRIDKRPMLGDLKDSGSIEEISDVIIFPYREEYYNKSDCSEYERNVAEIIVAKNKYGPVGSLKLKYKPEIQKFCPLTERLYEVF